MRLSSTVLIYIYYFIGVVSAVIFLLELTGYLFGWFSHEFITGFIIARVSQVDMARPIWWMIDLGGWAFVIWSTSKILKAGKQLPISISEDDKGTIEITPDALCRLAQSELKTQGVPGPLKADFTRKLGSPMLQVWVDLTSGFGGDGPVAMGERLKKCIDERLRNDFNLEGVLVSIIHQPGPRPKRAS
jgi:hypothetical protein